MVSDFEAARIAATGKVWLDRVVTKWTKVLVACPGQLSCQYCQSLGRCSRLRLAAAAVVLRFPD